MLLHIKEIQKIITTGRKLLSYVFKTSPFFLVVYIITLAIASILPFTSNSLTSGIIDELMRSVGQNQLTNTLIVLSIASVGVILARRLSDVVGDYAQIVLWLEVGKELSQRITKKFAYLDTEYYEDPET